MTHRIQKPLELHLRVYYKGPNSGTATVGVGGGAEQEAAGRTRYGWEATLPVSPCVHQLRSALKPTVLGIFTEASQCRYKWLYHGPLVTCSVSSNSPSQAVSGGGGRKDC